MLANLSSTAIFFSSNRKTTFNFLFTQKLLLFLLSSVSHMFVTASTHCFCVLCLFVSSADIPVCFFEHEMLRSCCIIGPISPRGAKRHLTREMLPGSTQQTSLTNSESITFFRFINI